MLTERYLNGIPNDSRAAKPGTFLKKNQITENAVEIEENVNALRNIEFSDEELQRIDTIAAVCGKFR